MRHSPVIALSDPSSMGQRWDAVEVGGFSIVFEREGYGPPLLLLHGFVGDGVGTWRYQLETLSDEFTVP
jgi:pimeloyl-ACP methyl ester carboxylesterase